MSAAEVKLSDQRLVKPFSSSLSKFTVVEAHQTCPGDGISLLDHSRESLRAGSSESMPWFPGGGSYLCGEGSLSQSVATPTP